MKVTKSSPLVLAVILACTPAVPAQLPSIDKKPWEKYFIVLKNRKFQFGITPDGEAMIHPLSKRGEIISTNNPIMFKVEILESKSDGKFISKKIDPNSLKSDQTASFNPENSFTYDGSVTGGATFEITITPDKQGFSISGKITDKGKLSNPLNVAISMGLRPYPKDATRTVGETKIFEQRVRRDKFEAIIKSGSRKSYNFVGGANFGSDMPTGVESLSMKSEAHDFTEFQVAVTGEAKITFEDKNQLVSDGVDFRWIIPADADPDTNILKVTAK
jgi:hypothetical protein